MVGFVVGSVVELVVIQGAGVETSPISLIRLFVMSSRSLIGP